MKKSRIFILCAIIAIFALATLLTACDGNVNIFGTSKYTVEVESSVKGIPNNIEITEEYVKSIISVYLKWNDGSTTPVSFDDCELTFDKNLLGKKLNIKVKFDRKTGKISIPIVDPSELEEDEEEPTVTTSIYGMVTPDMADDDDKFKSVLIVCVNFPTDSDESEGIELSADEYEIVQSNVSEDGKELEFRIYATEYDVYTAEGEAFSFYENTRLEHTGEDALERGMTKAEMTEAVKQNVKLYFVNDDGTKQEIQQDTPDVTVDEAGATITLKADEFETYGYTEFFFPYSKYAGMLIEFDWGKWKKNMTENDIIAGLYVYGQDDFVFNYTTEVEFLEYGFVRITMDGEVLCDMLYIAYDADENPFPPSDDGDSSN